ncbi:unnamed protein product, partial [Gulo gulo]
MRSSRVGGLGDPGGTDLAGAFGTLAVAAENRRGDDKEPPLGRTRL